MKIRVPDPEQPFDHEGNPEDGPARFIEVDVDPKRISPQLAEQLARKKRERLAEQELHRVSVERSARQKATAERKRLKKQGTRDCSECGETFNRGGSGHTKCRRCRTQTKLEVA